MVGIQNARPWDTQREAGQAKRVIFYVKVYGATVLAQIGIKCHGGFGCHDPVSGDRRTCFLEIRVLFDPNTMYYIEQLKIL